MRKKKILALVLAFMLMALTGCRAGTVGSEQLSASPAVSAGEELAEESETPASQPPETALTEPLESEPQPDDDAQQEDGDTTLTVDGQELAAVRRYSPLGYSIVYPEDQITLNAWEDGEAYQANAAKGTYLAVSRMEASNITEAAAIVQFENAVDDEPAGFMFGSGGYAGVRMIQVAGGLTQEFILVEQDGVIFLIERAIFTGGEEVAPLLQAMLDTFTIQ